MRVLPLVMVGLAAVLAGAAVAQSTADGADPLQWLENIESPRSLDWGKAQNTRTAAVLETDPRYEPFRRQAFDIFSAPDRIPEPEFLAGRIANFWQDKAHPRGVWRRTTVAAAGVRAPGLLSRASGTRALPMSCSSAACTIRCCLAPEKPIRSDRAAQKPATRRQCW